MLNNIQFLRALAALNVVLFHILGASVPQTLAPSNLKFLAGWGECGVDIFFVISGFVMVVAHVGKKISPMEFMVLRIHRVVPIYFFVTLLVLAVYALPPHLTKSASPSFGHVFASFLFISGAVIGKSPVVYVGWTLEYEMFFYALFALSLLLPRGLWKLGFQVVSMSFAVVFGANALIFEFLFGMLAGELFLRRAVRAYAPMVLISGGLLLCASIFIKSDLSRLIVWGFPSLLIVWGSAACRQIDSRILNYLGAASYCIYLIQVISLPAIYKVATHYPGVFSNEILAVVAVTFTALVGCLLHQYAEKPIAVWLKIRRPQVRAPLT